jgi:hypothetical protein
MDRKWYARRGQTGGITQAPARTTRENDLSWPCDAVRGVSVTRSVSAAAVQIVICSQSELNQQGNAPCEPKYGDPGDAIRVRAAPDVWHVGPLSTCRRKRLTNQHRRGSERNVCGLRSPVFVRQLESPTTSLLPMMDARGRKHPLPRLRLRRQQRPRLTPKEVRGGLVGADLPAMKERIE